jgi:hypothetical protein
MCQDKDPMVRVEVAERLAADRLDVFASDPDLRVRFTAAERIDPDHLHLFQDDVDPLVRDMATQRMLELGIAAHAPEPEPPAPSNVISFTAKLPVQRH